jgi:serine/threonine protein kinase
MTNDQTLDADLGPSEFERLGDLTPGTTVGPYVILDRLGRGGMGQVFLANDARLRRKVALKCLLSQRNARQDVRSQVLREARASARISHPNVATVHDVIEHGPRVFIVMEYVEGESLSARLRRGRLPIGTIITIGRQLASALAAAHARGIVHRDLKPANIQVALDGSVKVVDFGVAAAVAIPATVTAATEGYTDTAVRGLQAGTPGYMSPEQLVGRDAEPRSDIFSLGIVLFELATGQRLFADSDSLRIIAALAKPLPRADAIDPAVPRELSDIIARALETDPGRRIQSAAEFESALAELDQLRDRTTTRDRLTPPSVPPAVTAGVGVRDLRGRLILAHSQPELLRLKYEVEQYLATRPHDVDGRVLRDDVDRAIGAGPSSSGGRRLYVLAGTATLAICTALGISLYRSTPMTPAPAAPAQLTVEAPSTPPVLSAPTGEPAAPLPSSGALALKQKAGQKTSSRTDVDRPNEAQPAPARGAAAGPPPPPAASIPENVAPATAPSQGPRLPPPPSASGRIAARPSLGGIAARPAPPSAPTTVPEVETPGIPRRPGESWPVYAIRVRSIKANLDAGMNFIAKQEFALGLARFRAVAAAQKDYQGVEDLIADAQTKQRAAFDLAMKYGQDHENASRWSDALKWYLNAQAIDPGATGPRERIGSLTDRLTKAGLDAFARAEVLRKRSENAKAIESYKQAVESLPTNHEKAREAQRWLETLKP